MDASSGVSSIEGIMEEPHVLAVDDSLIDRKLVERLLRNSFCKVTTAENGLRALEYLGLGGGDGQSIVNDNASKVNLIITDYCMPGMTGYELLKKIKESSNMKDVPVVIVSSENVLRGRSSNVHVKASQIFRCKEVEMPIDAMQQLIIVLEVSETISF
ncbi:two-component response regulator ARR17 [Olea europaea subsp. europaea]|uniref:Two-component response regulator ARR17 n=1 Tax=Olea europaea subsp. europaea TaxID=158383 RepID=A0A8S0S2I0_OLEEU|nr:two-component response regulator ARR17 [Olea europaea subsp. europaea]